MGTDLGDASTARAYTPIHDGPMTSQLHITENEVSPTLVKKQRKPNNDLEEVDDDVAAIVGKKSVFIASGS